MAAHCAVSRQADPLSIASIPSSQDGKLECTASCLRQPCLLTRATTCAKPAGSVWRKLSQQNVRIWCIRLHYLQYDGHQAPTTGTNTIPCGFRHAAIGAVAFHSAWYFERVRKNFGLGDARTDQMAPLSSPDVQTGDGDGGRTCACPTRPRHSGISRSSDAVMACKLIGLCSTSSAPAVIALLHTVVSFPYLSLSSLAVHTMTGRRCEPPQSSANAAVRGKLGHSISRIRCAVCQPSWMGCKHSAGRKTRQNGVFRLPACKNCQFQNTTIATLAGRSKTAAHEVCPPCRPGRW